MPSPLLIYGEWQSITEPSEYVLDSYGRGADFTLYRGRQHGTTGDLSTTVFRSTLESLPKDSLTKRRGEPKARIDKELCGLGRGDYRGGR
jgi:hypothetical protein